MWLLVVALAVCHRQVAAISRSAQPARRKSGRRFRPFVFLVATLARVAPGAKPRAQKALIRFGYHLLSVWMRDERITLMNYGYVPLDPSDPHLVLHPEDEVNRYSLQLYARVVGAVDLHDKDVLEVGCGRGGGAAFLKQYLKPRKVIGIDFAGEAIKFCRRRYRIGGLYFRQGDAEKLPFPANAFDAVVNVESSHNYPSVERFFAEVQRVLRPGGYFLFADMRLRPNVDIMLSQLQQAGLTLLVDERITPNVARALELDSERRWSHFRASIPAFLSKMFELPLQEFVGCKGTPVYEALCSGEVQYLRLVLRKPTSPQVAAGVRPARAHGETPQ
jgi:ubiquinone/menaquinone biosynthesis C-methylase UbiE